MNRYVETPAQPNILEAGKPYVTNFPRRLDIDPNKVANRIFDDGVFTAYLSGAIQVSKISGRLQYRTA